MSQPAVTPSPGSLLDSWRQIILSGNLPKGRGIDVVSRWLLITRACVFSMTITSALIGGLLAASTAPTRHWGYFSLALLGLVVAHAANNMINDYFDTIGGVDTESYIRTLYAPHPLFSNLISKEGLIAAILVCNLTDLAIGWPIGRLVRQADFHRGSRVGRQRQILADSNKQPG